MIPEGLLEIRKKAEKHELLDKIGKLNDEEDRLLEELTTVQEALVECLLAIEPGEEES